ncbi:MAG: DUF1552 domain-containing protein [Pirellulaceae bacterium]
MTRKTTVHRRTFLRGLGTTMALPLLDAMSPAARAAAPASPPIRMAFVFCANGAIMPSWKPAPGGEKLELSETLKPLEKHGGELLVLSGLAQHHGRANGDGAGDHARCASSFLTGAQPRKTSGADIHVGVSVDQAAAARIGKRTRLPSLELGIERGRNAGNCDSGYSCAYSSNVSWKTPSTPMAKEINPKLAYERLFGPTDTERQKPHRDLFRQSVLDLVAEDAAQLRRRLGKTDRRKLDEYFTSVRELEQRLAGTAGTKNDAPDYDVPEGIPRDLDQHIRLMYDIIALAFQADSTRVCTYMLANAGSNRTYPMVDVRSGHHSLSHHRDDKQKMADIAKIDRYLIAQFGYFLDKLAAIEEGEGTLLDNSMILYGSGIADANRHSHHDLPILVAGRGGGTLKTGRYLEFPKDTPLNNLFLSMCKRVGADVKKLGDSTGELPRLL